MINATGVLLHTNLGRAPLAAAHAGAGDQPRARPGHRASAAPASDHCGRLLARLCGAEAAIVVNNNAAAVLLVLAALAAGREVLVSRGESVEIGGGFRVPEVMEQSGARLVDVGTTNRTRLRRLPARARPPRRRRGPRAQGAPVATTASRASSRTTTVADAGDARRAGRRRHRLGPARRRLPVAAGGPPAVAGGRAGGPPDARRRRRARDLQRRQAARRPAGRRHRRPGRPGRRVRRATRWPGPCGPAALVLAALQDVALAYLRRDAGTTVPFWRMAGRPGRRPRGSGRRGRRPAAGAGSVVDTDESLPGAGSLPGTTIPSVGRRARRRPAGRRCGRPTRRSSPACATGATVPRPAHRRPRRRRHAGAGAGRPVAAAPPVRVVATAGHVDHGKSSLVLALTGTDPDRFEEEKRRGLTIDLGFAHTTLPSGEAISFVDVPGHVRFLRTCSPASARSTPACSSSPPPRAGSRRARSTCASSSCSASATASSP